MTFVIKTSGISIADLQAKPHVSKPCEAMVKIEKVIVKDGAVVFIFDVLACTKLRQIGRTFAEHLNLPNGNSDTAEMLKKRIIRFLLAFDVLTEEDIEAGEDFDIDFKKMKGARAIVQFVAKTNSQIQIPFFGIWSLYDPSAPHVA